MNGPSAHLTWKELGCKDGTPYPVEWQDRAQLLAVEFELLRQCMGPLVVLSAYRSPAHNARVGGARLSQHVQGRALDLRTPRGWTPVKMALVVKTLVKDGKSKIRGLGIYPWGVHIDVRLSERLVVWSSTAQKEA